MDLRNRPRITVTPDLPRPVDEPKKMGTAFEMTEQ